MFAGDEPGCIDISDQDIGDDGVKELSEMIVGAPDKVMSIFAMRCGMSADGLATLCKALAAVPELRMVDVSGNEVGSEGGAAIAALIAEGSVENIVAEECGLGDEGASVIAGALKDNENVGRLNLPGNGIGDEGLAALADMFSSNKMCGAVVLGDNEFGAEGMTAFGEAFAASEVIEMLRLNNIGAEAAGAFAEAGLAGNTGCYELCLADCGMGPDAMGKVAEALKANKAVVELDLSGNGDCGDEGALALAAMLGENATIESLDLTGCGIGNDGATALIEAFKASSTLSSLTMDDNAADDDVMAELEAAAEGK